MALARSAALAIVALLALAGSASAAIPAGNLLANGDGERGTAVSDATSRVCPESWTCRGGAMTLVRYGTTTFPSAAESARIGGGSAFFAGGPNSETSEAFQELNLSTARSEINAGGVQITFGGCLGGAQTLDDSSNIALEYGDAEQGKLGADGVDGPASAAERGNETKLLPRFKTSTLPRGVRFVSVSLLAFRKHPAPAQSAQDRPPSRGSYNDGYADNISVQLSPLQGPAPPTPSCGGSNTGGGGNSGGGAPGGGPNEKLSYKRTQDIDNLFVYVRSDKDASLKTSASVAVPAGAARTLAFKTVRKALKAGKRTKIRFRLAAKRKAAVKRALRRGRRLKARIKLTATDAAGKRQVRRATIRLKN
jgi:hypothetical protein